MSWSTFVLFLHVLLAVFAFGPTVAFALIGKMSEREPMHGNFALRVTHAIESKMTVPASILMPFLGLILIYLNDWDLWASEWLIIAIVVYCGAFFFANFVQNRWLLRMIELTGGHPSHEGHAAPVSGAQGPPPPEFFATANKVKFGGMYLTLSLLVLVLLMVWKPGGQHLLP